MTRRAKELNLQTNELKNTVAQHKEMVETNKQSLEYIKQKDSEEKSERTSRAQPALQIISMKSTFNSTRKSGQFKFGNIEFSIWKTGADISGVEIKMVLCEIDGEKIKSTVEENETHRSPIWITGEHPLVVKLPRDSYGKLVDLYWFVNYEDAEGNNQLMGMNVSFKGESIENRPRSGKPVDKTHT